MTTQIDECQPNDCPQCQQIDSRSPMEIALARALAALQEIEYCANVGSSNLCHIEAKAALEEIAAMNIEMTKIDEDDMPSDVNIRIINYTDE